jgi:hypothetical protein
MNTFFKFIAWLGIILLVIGAIISFYSSWQIMTAEPGEIGVDFGHWFAILFGIPGIVMMIIGGIISKPKNFWLVSIVSGLFYIISFFQIYVGFPYRMRAGQIGFMLVEISFSILPGLIPVIMGIQLRKDEKRRQNTQQPDVPF